MSTITIRLPDDVHAQAKEQAKIEERSLNNWLVRVIKQAVTKKEGGK